MPAEQLADGVLLPLLHAGDHAAHGALFVSYGQLVYGFCARRCGDRGRAEDLMSVVFLEVWRCRSSILVVDDSLRPWLLGVATNVLRHEARSRRRHQDALSRFATVHASADPDDMVDVDEALTVTLHARVALRAISEPPRREREVAELCLVEQLTTAGGALGVREGAVRYRLGRARSHLRRVLDRLGEESAAGAVTGHQVGIGPSGRTPHRPVGAQG